MVHMFAEIIVDDNLAYVQGMAMGKRGDSAEVNWEEVAVGLGHLLITINLLVMKYRHEYRKIASIQLLGSQSEIHLKGKKRSYFVLNTRESERNFGEMLEVLLYEIYHLSEHILEL